MAKRKPSTLRRRIALGGFALGILFMPGFNYVTEKLENWIGQIVIMAVHQHWQYEQQVQLFKPADGPM